MHPASTENKGSLILGYDPSSANLINLSDVVAEEASQLSQLKIPDNREKVNETDLYPYNCIGLIVSYYNGNPNPVVGTGVLIGSRHVLTVSHNCYIKKNFFNPIA